MLKWFIFQIVAVETIFHWTVRAEKSTEAFREPKLVMVPFLNLLLQLCIFLSMAEKFNLSVFGLWGDTVQCYRYFNVKIISGAILKGRISSNGKDPWLKHLLDGLSICSREKVWLFREHAPRAPPFFQLCPPPPNRTLGPQCQNL